MFLLEDNSVRLAWGLSLVVFLTPCLWVCIWGLCTLV